MVEPARTQYCVPTSLCADALVNGTIESVEIEARDSSVAQVLTALGVAFDLRHRSSTRLDRPVTGSFRGPLLTVIPRLLKDYDHVVKRSDTGPIEVTVIRLRELAPNPPTPLSQRPPFSSMQARDKVMPPAGGPPLHPHPPKSLQPRPPHRPGS